MQKRFMLADLHRYGQNKHGFYVGVNGIFSEKDDMAALYPTLAIAETVGENLGRKTIHQPHAIAASLRFGG